MVDNQLGQPPNPARQGSDLVWPIHAAYEVVHGILRPVDRVGEPRQRYHPVDHPEIVGEIAKLHEGDEKGLVAFAQIWGPLGVQVMAPAGAREPAVIQGDPLPWVWAHARGIRMVLELRFYLQEQDLGGLAEFLGSYPRPRPPHASQDTILLSTGGPSGIVEQRLPWVVEAPGETARGVIAAIMNPNLSEVGYRLDILGDEEELRPIPTFTQLIDVAYWHLATAVTGARRLERCRECDTLFVQTDGRQRFCPGPPEWKAKTGSLCGARFRKRERRKKKGD